MKRLWFILLAAFTVGMFQPTTLQAQDLPHYKKIVKKLSSAKYQGRGYANDGANKAGRYLLKEFKNAGVDMVATHCCAIS